MLCIILTKFVTRPLLQNLKSGTVNIELHPKICLIFELVIPTGDLASEPVIATDTRGDRGNLANVPIHRPEEFEIGNGKNYPHPKIPNILETGIGGGQISEN